MPSILIFLLHTFYFKVNVSLCIAWMNSVVIFLLFGFVCRLFLFNIVYMYLRGYIPHGCICPWRSEEDIDQIGSDWELQVVVNHSTWVSETELEVSERTVSIFTRWAIFPVTLCFCCLSGFGLFGFLFIVYCFEIGSHVAQAGIQYTI